MLQTFIFLKLAVARHLTIFVTRTRGPFWSIGPSRLLLWSSIITKLMATLPAVYGVLMIPTGWRWAALSWGYSLAEFVVNDRVKLAAYRIFDPQPVVLSKPKLFALANPRAV